MDATVLTTLSTLLLGCKEMFHVQPESVVIHAFVLEDGNIFRYRYDETSNKSRVNVALPSNLEGQTIKGIRLGAELKDGEVFVAGQIHIGVNKYVFSGNGDNLEKTDLLIAAGDAAYFAKGKVYQIYCSVHKVSMFTLEGTETVFVKRNTNISLPCEGLSFSEDGTSVFFEQDSQCKTAFLSSSLKQEDVFDCTAQQIFKNPGSFISNLYSLRYLVVNYGSCFNDPDVLTEELLDNTHVQFRYAEPTTTTMGSATEKTTSLSLLYGVIVGSVLVVLIGLVTACVIVCFFCRGRIRKKKGESKSPDPNIAVVVEPPMPTPVLPGPKNAAVVEPPMPTPVLPGPKTAVVVEPSKPNQPDLPAGKAKELPADKLKNADPVLKAKGGIAADEDGLAGTETFIAYKPGDPPGEGMDVSRECRLTVNNTDLVLVKIQDKFPTFSGGIAPYAFVEKGTKAVFGIKFVSLEGLELLKVEVKILEQLNKSFEEKERLHPTVFRASHCCFTKAREGGILVSEFYAKNVQTEAVKLDLPRAFILGYRCLLGLRQLHSIGFAHLNVTPASFVFNREDKVILTEFGIGRRFGRERFLNYGDVMFASIGSHDFSLVAELDDYQSWLLMVLSFMAELPYSSIAKSNENLEDKARLWSEVRAAKWKLIANIKDDERFGGKESTKILVNLSKLTWSPTKEGTMDFNGVVSFLEKTVSDHKMNMHKSPWWSKQNTFEPTPTEVGDLRLLTTPAH
ncbi:unnamed protein product [Bursaphelenchus xylophilus]|nr:unnamed protein product [Bursaphelenchus xylophilus]CAG9100336.1 unnamed protein product [Bursaphelenchus xylophilus]